MGPNIDVSPMDSSMHISRNAGQTIAKKRKTSGDRMTAAPSIVQKAEPEPSSPSHLSDSAGGHTVKSLSSNSAHGES